jgi:hypothetical protein
MQRAPLRASMWKKLVHNIYHKLHTHMCRGCECECECGHWRGDTAPTCGSGDSVVVVVADGLDPQGCLGRNNGQVRRRLLEYLTCTHASSVCACHRIDAVVSRCLICHARVCITKNIRKIS